MPSAPIGNCGCLWPQLTRRARPEAVPEYLAPVPGEIEAPAFGIRLRIKVSAPAVAGQSAMLRNWKPGDRVRLRYSSGPRKVKEVLERLKVTGTARTLWPVLELGERIVWMRGAELEPEPGMENRGHTARRQRCGSRVCRNFPARLTFPKRASGLPPGLVPDFPASEYNLRYCSPTGGGDTRVCRGGVVVLSVTLRHV